MAHKSLIRSVSPTPLPSSPPSLQSSHLPPSCYRHLPLLSSFHLYFLLFMVCFLLICSSFFFFDVKDVSSIFLSLSFFLFFVIFFLLCISFRSSFFQSSFFLSYSFFFSFNFFFTTFSFFSFMNTPNSIIISQII